MWSRHLMYKLPVCLVTLLCVWNAGPGEYGAVATLAVATQASRSKLALQSHTLAYVTGINRQRSKLDVFRINDSAERKWMESSDKSNLDITTASGTRDGDSFTQADIRITSNEMQSQGLYSTSDEKDPINHSTSIFTKSPLFNQTTIFSSGRKELMSSLEPRRIRSEPPVTEEQMLQQPFVSTQDKKLNFSLDSWPANCYLRIRLVGYCGKDLQLAIERIREGVKQFTNLQVGSAQAFPTKRKRWCLLSSAHADKRSKDLIEIVEQVRVIDIFPAKENKSETAENNDENKRLAKDQGTNNRLLIVPLPKFVSFDYWFAEIYQPTKRKFIDALFERKVWISKYFIYHRDKREKQEIIQELTSPEYENEIPLPWKRHKNDYYALQLTELRKLHKFVRLRKASDEARKQFNVKMPTFYDIDKVRFIGNMEDRKCDYEMDSKLTATL